DHAGLVLYGRRRLRRGVHADRRANLWSHLAICCDWLARGHHPAGWWLAGGPRFVAHRPLLRAADAWRGDWRRRGCPGLLRARTTGGCNRGAGEALAHHAPRAPRRAARRLARL